MSGGAWGLANGLVNSISGGVGSTLNLLTGKSQSAKQQYKQNLKLQQQAQEFAKWQMGNAHQMEIQDLENAGLNPVLSAGGGGASASVGGGSTGAGAGGTDPFAIIGEMINSMNSVKQTNATVENLKTDAIKNLAEATAAKANAAKANAETSLTNQTEAINEPDEETAKTLRWWNSTWVGKASNVVGDIMGKVSPFTAQAINYNSAKQIRKGLEKPTNTTQTTTHYNSHGKVTGYTKKQSTKSK